MADAAAVVEALRRDHGFAGHGITLDGDTRPAGYLVPADAQRADRERSLPMRAVNRGVLRRAGLTRDELREIVAAPAQGRLRADGSVARALTHRAATLYELLVAEHAAYAATIGNLFSRMVAW